MKEKILANTVYKTSTLRRCTKQELIEHIRVLEHNWQAAEDCIKNQAKYMESILDARSKSVEGDEYTVDVLAKRLSKCSEKVSCKVCMEKRKEMHYLDCPALEMASKLAKDFKVERR